MAKTRAKTSKGGQSHENRGRKSKDKRQAALLKDVRECNIIMEDILLKKDQGQAGLSRNKAVIGRKNRNKKEYEDKVTGSDPDDNSTNFSKQLVQDKMAEKHTRGRAARKATLGKKYADSSSSENSMSDYNPEEEDDTISSGGDSGEEDIKSDEEVDKAVKETKKKMPAIGKRKKISTLTPKSMNLAEEILSIREKESKSSFVEVAAPLPYDELPGRANLSESDSSDSEMEVGSKPKFAKRSVKHEPSPWIDKGSLDVSTFEMDGSSTQSPGATKVDNNEYADTAEAKDSVKLKLCDSQKSAEIKTEKITRALEANCTSTLKSDANKLTSGKKKGKDLHQSDKKSRKKEKKSNSANITANDEPKLEPKASDLVVPSIAGASLSFLHHAHDLDESDDEDWEDVLEARVADSTSPHKNKSKQKPSEDVQVSLQVSNKYTDRRKKKEEKYRLYIERAIRRFHREVQVNVHKVHLLCLLANLQRLNDMCNDEAAKGLCLSLLPDYLSSVPVKKFNAFQLSRVVAWFKSACSDAALHPALSKFTSESTIYSPLLQMAQAMVCTLRALGLLVRLVVSLQPMSPKVESQKSGPTSATRATPKGTKRGFKSPTSTPKGRDGAKKKVPKSAPIKVTRNDVSSGVRKASPHFVGNKSVPKDDASSTKKKETRKKCDGEKRSQNEKGVSTVTRKCDPLNTKARKVTPTNIAQETSQVSKEPTPRSRGQRRKRKASHGLVTRDSKGNTKDSKMADSVKKEKKTGKGKERGKRPLRKRRKVSYADRDEGSTGNTSDSSSNGYAPDNPLSEMEDDLEDFEQSPSYRSRGSELDIRLTKIQRLEKIYKDNINMKLLRVIDDDNAFEETSKPLRTGLSRQKSEVISADSSDDSSLETVERGVDVWLEVFLHAEDKWICAELSSWTINRPEVCERSATQPLQYVVGIDNDGGIKDVTCRYASKWLSQTRKRRVDRDWWADTLQPHQPRNSELNKKEDKHLTSTLSKQPMPTTVGDFKGHPLYALRRHLLKFEAIYPEHAAPLGYIRNEPIYSRDCVYVLHSRESWIKEAKVVRRGETPYKIVKGRPKKNTPTHERDSLKLELFGIWQTEPYKPPPAKNGKVPRNEYGNVELFKPCMLPPGTVHVPIQGIHKVAKKLNIDAPLAMVGWEAHCGYSVPLFEGVVVCKEFEDKLLDGWNRMEEEVERKKKEKREKRVYDRWKLLIRGVLVRERLKKKYTFTEVEEESPSEPEHKPTKEDDDYTNLSVAWPQNRMEGTTALDDEGHCHIFPKAGHKQDPLTGFWTKSCACGLTLPLDR